METKKAYGIVTAIGTKLGERAKIEPEILAALRATPDLPAFDALTRTLTEGLVPPVLLTNFFAEVVTGKDWMQWRARILLQAKLVRDGGKPAPGHEKGRGVGGP